MKIEFHKYKFIFKAINKVVEDKDKLTEIVEILGNVDINVRQCSNCEKLMVEGYVVEGGQDYYCCDKCLENNMSRKEFEELYDEGGGESYFTQWD